jgi:hypothetical protein
MRRFVPLPDLSRCSKSALLNYLVGGGEHRRRKVDPESPSRLEIDDEFKFGGLLYWNICGLRAFESLVDVNGRLTENLIITRPHMMRITCLRSEGVDQLL